MSLWVNIIVVIIQQLERRSAEEPQWRCREKTMSHSSTKRTSTRSKALRPGTSWCRNSWGDQRFVLWI